ncbi:glucosyltransferase domain-containing protein [Pseudomonadota bacterium]
MPIRDRFYQDVWVFAVTGSLLMMATGLFLGTIAVDDELNLFLGSFDGIGRGLWGHQLVTFLLPGQLGISFAPMLLGILLYATSTTILIYFWGIRDQVAARLSAFIIGAFPYFASMMTFDVVQVAYPLGFVCIIFSLYPVFMKSGFRHYCFGVALFALAFSLYQGVASAALTAFASIVGMRFILAENKEDALNQILRSHIPRFLVISSLGSATYLVTSKIVQAVFDHHKWVGGYELAVDLAFSKERLYYIAYHSLGLLTGWENDLPGLSVALFFLMITVLSVSVFLLKKLPMAKKLLLFVAVWLIFCLSPFWLMFVQINPLAPRSTVGLAILYGFVFAALASIGSGTLRKLVLGVAAIWCVQFIFLGNEMYYTQHLVYQSDRDTATRIVSRIDSLPGIEQLPFPVPTTFVGMYKHPPNGSKKYSVLGASMFEWDGGNIYRQMAFFGVVNVSGLQLLATKEISEEVETFVLENKIPSWPRPGSVFIYGDDTVVVNLGPRTAARTNLKRSVQKIRDLLL